MGELAIVSRAGTSCFLAEEAKNEDRIIGTTDVRTHSQVSSEAPRAPLTTRLEKAPKSSFLRAFHYIEVTLVSVVQDGQHGLVFPFDHWSIMPVPLCRLLADFGECCW